MKKLLTVIVLCAAVNMAIGQRTSYLEAGFMFGLTNYSGDVAESSIELSETKLGYGAYLRYHVNPWFSTKAHIYTGAISGDDANAKDKILRQRGFRFSTSLVELGAVGEWNILGQNRFSRTGIHQFFITPYIFAGMGVTFANAEAEYYTAPDKLDDYVTDPSEFNVNRREKFLLVPMGVGLRADIFDRLVIGLEGSFRPVFSDKLDGISTNANPDSGDWYYFVGTTVSFILSNPKRR